MSDNAVFSGGEMYKRVKLSEQVPLDKPFTVNISASNVCNLKCEFCTYNQPDVRKKKMSIGKNGILDINLLKHTIDDIKSSFGHIKQIFFTGCGDPLLNRDLPEMVKYVSQQNISDRIDILTNGVGLSHKMSDELIESGLTYLRISVNGLSADDYEKYTGVKIDFDKYLEQLAYFYKHKKQTKVYLKIINYMVDSPEKKQKFYDLFSSVCDIINIENLYFFEGTKVEDTVDTKFRGRALYSDVKNELQICSVPFYYQFMDIDGSIYPCCEKLSNDNKGSVGNINNESFAEIWNKQIRGFQRNLLNGKNNVEYCRNCKSSLAWERPEDNLDKDVDAIKERYDKLLMKG